MVDNDVKIAVLAPWPSTRPEDVTAFRARVAELLHGWEQGFDAGAASYTRDERVRIWDGTAVPGPGYRAYERETRPWMDSVDELRNTMVEVQVLRAPEGGLAVTVTVLDSAGRMQDGTEFSLRMRETLVWAQDGDQWRVVHEHTSPLPEAKA